MKKITTNITLCNFCSKVNWDIILLIQLGYPNITCRYYFTMMKIIFIKFLINIIPQFYNGRCDIYYLINWQ